MLALIVAAAQSGTALASDRIDFINENDTGSVTLGLVEEIPDTGGAHADEHLYKFSAADGEEWDVGFAGNSVGQ